MHSHIARKKLRRYRRDEALRLMAPGAAFFEALLRNVGDAIIATDLSGQITYWNQGATHVFGYSSEEMLGQSVRVLYSRELQEVFRRDLKKISEGHDYKGEWKGKKKDGSPIWIDIKTTRLMDQNGKHIGFLSVSKDITVRKVIQEELIASEKRFRTMLEQSPISTQIFSAEGDTIVTNRAWEKLWGVKLQEIGEYNILKDKQLVKLGIMPFIKKAFEGRASVVPAVKYEPEKTIGHKGAVAYRWVKAFIYPIKDEKGKVVEVVLMHEDITKQKESEAELQRYRDRLEQAQFAGDIGIFEVDLINKKTWRSSQQVELLGINQKLAESTDFMLADTVVLADRKRIKQELKYSIQRKVDFESEYRVIHPDKSLHWLRSKGHIYYDRKSKPSRLVGVTYDITRRKLMEQSLRFKAEATRALSLSLNYQQTLDKVSRLAVKTIADWCAVDLVNDSKGVDLVSVAHIDPLKVKWAKQLRRLNPVDMNAPNGLPNVLRTGKTEFIPLVTDEMITAAAKNKKELALIRKIGFTSVIIAPIKLGERTVGAITFVSAESKRQYGQTELEIAEQVASRAALAIENSRLYETLKSQQDRLQNLLANVPAIVWEAWGKPDEANQKIDFVSQHVERMLGYTSQEWLSTPNFWLSLVHPEDRERAAKEAADIYAKGEGGTSRFRWLTKDGKELWVEAQSYVVKDKKGNPIGMRGVNIDITDQMEQVKRKDDFLSMASHELKTPVTSIKAFAQILEALYKRQNDLKALKAAEYLQKMHIQIDKLTDLISELLDVNRIQQGKLQFVSEKFDFDLFMKELVDNLQTTIPTHKIKLLGQTNRRVDADRDRLGQVVSNLITNAVKYSPHATKVLIKLSTKDDNVVVAVKDFGIGIAKKHQDKIFDRFYRVYDQDETRFPGLGIGLYISYQIVARHGGNMWLKSKVGKGSTFYFSIPAKKTKAKKGTQL